MHVYIAHITYGLNALCFANFRFVLLWIVWFHVAGHCSNLTPFLFMVVNFFPFIYRISSLCKEERELMC